MTSRLTKFLYVLFVGGVSPLLGQADVVIASLNPIMGDLARQVGGEYVQVVDVVKPGMDPHDVTLTPDDVQKAKKADVVIVSGKGLEQVDVRDQIGDDADVFEMGRMVPSVLAGQDPSAFVCCPHHAVGNVDPYWWHSIENVIRASRHLSIKLAHMDPDHADAYRANAQTYLKRLEDLKSWARKEFRSIPRKDRKLVTAHLMYGYFCKEFGLQPLAVAGLTSEESPTPAQIEELVDTLRKENVRVVFPGTKMNPDLQEAMEKDAGVWVGGHLLSTSPDPELPTYEAMMEHNIRTILAAFLKK